MCHGVSPAPPKKQKKRSPDFIHRIFDHFSEDVTTVFSREYAQFPSQQCGALVETKKDGDAGERSNQSYREQRRGKNEWHCYWVFPLLTREAEEVGWFVWSSRVGVRWHLNVITVDTRATVTLSVPGGFKTTPLLALTMCREIPTVSGEKADVEVEITR